jgi:flagellar basal body-associated protein FliL
MADEEGVEGEGEGEEGGKKKSKKKLIIMIVVMLIIGYEAASMTVLKPPPLTAAQKKAKEEKVKYDLEVKCAFANDVDPPAPPPTTVPKGKKAEKPAPTTVPEPANEALPVLSLDSVTVNLADGQHLLKLGLGLQFPAGTVIDDVFKGGNPGAPALNYVITTLRKKSMSELKGDLEPLRRQLGDDICKDPTLNAGGKISTIFFVDFVMQ